MTAYLTVEHIRELHKMVLVQTGGSDGIRSVQGLESAVAQPQASFDGVDLYPSLAEKAAALAYSLIQNHPFVDGNKRVGHAAMEVFLVLNGYELDADVDRQEAMFLSLAAGEVKREDLVEFVRQHLISFPGAD